MNNFGKATLFTGDRTMKSHCQMLLGACMLVALAACSSKSGDGASTEEPKADAGMVAEAVENAAEAAEATHPLCELVTFAEIQAAGAGNVSKLDVIDAADSNSIECVYLDQDNYLGAGMSLKFITSEKLARNAGSPWSTAAEYFEEWTRRGAPVAGLGEESAWVDSVNGKQVLYVLKRDNVVLLDGTAPDTANAAGRANVEALAHQLVARMP